jgi:hypothetical protein
MSDIWQQFLQLPRPVRNAASTPEAMQTIEKLEATYPGVDLAGFVMRVLVKDIPLDQLPSRLVLEAGVDTAQARSIMDELVNSVFASVQTYLGPSMQSAPPLVEVETVAAPPIPIAPMSPIGERAPAPAVSPEDDQEIASLTARLKTMSPTVVEGVEVSAQRVLDQHQLAFSEELMTKRALSILKARLKGIRDDTATVDMLTREQKIGGLGMDPDLAANVVQSLSQVAAELKSRGMTETVTPPPPPMPIPMPKVETVRPAPKPPLTREWPDGPPAVQPEAQPGPSTVVPPPLVRPADMPMPPPVTDIIKPVEPPPDIAPPSSPMTPMRRTMERPSVSDITKPTRAFGPGEEMKSLTLVEFRRLGTGATESTKKLLEKFQHLKGESFKLWSDAVTGWRQSEVYLLYLDMGRQSLEQNSTVKDVIQQRARQNQSYLSEHEFMMVADFNHQLIP